jgi:Protein of unknown function (DUF2934)
MQDLEQAIRERAYHLWNATGRRHGDAEAHWLTAQREILASSLGATAHVSDSQTTPKAAKKPKSKKRLRAA